MVRDDAQRVARFGGTGVVRSIALVIANPTPDLEAALYGLKLEAEDAGCAAGWAEQESTDEEQR